MFDLKRKLSVLVMGCLLLVGVLLGVPLGVNAQKQGDKRPPKDDNKVVVQPKGEKPPPPSNNNQNQGDKRGDKRGRP